MPSSDAEAELAMAKQQGREMVNEARAYRERVLSELARRRELAREQIEQLMHGRDRLMQAFERARVVAVDVVAELKPLGEPDEYVNLSPTTGPVPVMVPNSRRPDDRFEPIADMPGLETREIAAIEPDADSSLVDEPELGQRCRCRGGRRRCRGPVDGEAVDVEIADDETEPAPDDVEAADRTSSMPMRSTPTSMPTTTTRSRTSVSRSRTGGSAEAVADDEVDEAADTRDDVVVDLFARLRAESAPPVSIVDTDQASRMPTRPPRTRQPMWAKGPNHPTGRPTTAETAETGDSPFRRRDAELTPLIVASARKLKRVLADEQNDVLDRLRRSEPVRSLDEFLPCPRSARRHVCRGHRRRTAPQRRAPAPRRSPPAAPRSSTRRRWPAAVGAARTALGEWLVNPLRDRLDRCVADGAGDNDAIARSIRSVYREWKTQHIDDQLDDVLRTAHGRAVLAALPAGAPVCWGVDAGTPGLCRRRRQRAGRLCRCR